MADTIRSASGRVADRRGEWLFAALLGLAAAVAMAALILITFFVWREGWPILARVGPLAFVFGRRWEPTSGVFGVFPQLVGSIYVTIGALVLAIPFGVGGAVFLAEFAPAWMRSILRPAVSLLAAIPSVVYGFVAMNLLLPLLQGPTGGLGMSLLAGAIVLAVMILPTLIGIAEDAIRAVPPDFRQASMGLGASHWQTIWRVVLPAARPGLLAAVILGAGRAIGETMAVMMVTGNVFIVPRSILQPGATLTGTIALEFAYAGPEHQRALFAVGIVLLLFIVVMNTAAQVAAGLARRRIAR
ncbi:MAG: phosphate ABC transporter permease subunit PstC [Firmicutes bacterium]|nr:phosphate ABC transporter permease subunit PstC [Bacillota bacterium]